LITWLAYAAYLHARATAGWKGTKASVVSLIGYGTVLFSYFAVNLIFNGLHSYGGV
jgi:ABC-type transport system involved in cytochrome c biogenesis permease subunit